MPSSEGAEVNVEVTVLLGAPGSGKGTQAKEACKEGNFIHLSTGDVLRAAIKKGSDLGQKAQTFMDAGNLVPDDLMIGLLEDTLKGYEKNSRILLDGFPRTDTQAEALEESSANVTQAIYFNVPEDLLVERITGRRVCGNCGAVFHTSFRPAEDDGKCDNCGGELNHRADDVEEVVRKRLEVYWKQTEPLIDFYKKRNKLKEVNANQPIKNVQAEFRKFFV